MCLPIFIFLNCLKFISGIFKDNHESLKKENPLNIDTSIIKKNRDKNPIIYIKKSNIIH